MGFNRYISQIDIDVFVMCQPMPCCVLNILFYMPIQLDQPL